MLYYLLISIGPFSWLFFFWSYYSAVTLPHPNFLWNLYSYDSTTVYGWIYWIYTVHSTGSMKNSNDRECAVSLWDWSQASSLLEIQSWVCVRNSCINTWRLYKFSKTIWLCVWVWMWNRVLFLGNKSEEHKSWRNVQTPTRISQLHTLSVKFTFNM